MLAKSARLAAPGRTLAIVSALLPALEISLLPIHGVGHNDYAPVNLSQLFQRGRLV